MNFPFFSWVTIWEAQRDLILSQNLGFQLDSRRPEG